MAIKDPFSYVARWDSIGLDCSFCKNFIGPETWPDEEGSSFCKYHNIPLSFELNDQKYKDGEWFCKHFENNSHTFPDAIVEFESIQYLLKENIIYKGDGGEFLKEKEIRNLKPFSASDVP